MNIVKTADAVNPKNVFLRFIDNPAAIQEVNGFEDSEAGNISNTMAGAKFEVVEWNADGTANIRLIDVQGWENQIIYDVYLNDRIIQ